MTRLPYHLIFDMDGTLVDTEFAVSKITQQLAAEKGFDLPPDIVHQHFSGYAPHEKFQGIAARLGGLLAEDDLAAMAQRHEALKKDLYRKDDIPPVATIPALLGHLAQQGHILSVATSADSAVARMALDKTGMSGYFGRRVFGADSSPTGMKKPAPDVYLHAMAAGAQDHGGLPVIAIEDSVAGVMAAHAAGIPTIIGYLDTHYGTGTAAQRRHAELLAAGATAVLRGFEDIAAFDAALPVQPPRPAPRPPLPRPVR